MITARLTDLNYNEILMYLGYRGQQFGPELESQIRRCMDEVMKTAAPRLVYAVFPLDAQKMEAGGLVLEGQDMKALLKESSEVVFLGATVGAGVSAQIARVQVTDMASAIIMDSCASCAIENVCNNFEEDFRRETSERGLFLTDRFSPGYGDLPISLQPSLCAALNTQRRIGLTVTDNFLMIPQKSVTALMGISDKKQPKRKSGCEVCSMFLTCEFRKQGRTC